MIRTTLPRTVALMLSTFALYAGGSSLVACGDEAAQNKDYGAPPDAAIFNPNPNVGPGDG